MVGVKRGEIWLTDLNPIKGSEQMGTRPNLVVSNDVTNEFAATGCVLPLTSNLTGSQFPINVILHSEESGLKWTRWFWAAKSERLPKRDCSESFLRFKLRKCLTLKQR